MVMDLDSFKEINDNHGHHVGDRALCEMARVLRTRSGPTTSASATPATSSSSCMSGCGAEEAEQKREELQRAHRRGVLRGAARASACARHQRRHRRVPARTASRTRRCSPTADSRMYQDKATRKRRSREEDVRQRGPGAARARNATASRLSHGDGCTELASGIALSAGDASDRSRTRPRAFAADAIVRSARRHHPGDADRPAHRPARSAPGSRSPSRPGRPRSSAADSRCAFRISIASAPPKTPRAGHELEFLIKVEPLGPLGRISSTALRRGTAIGVHGPLGRSCSRRARAERRFLFIAGGTGIAPLRAMIRQALRERAEGRIRLLYSARTPIDFAYLPELGGMARTARDSSCVLHGDPRRDRTTWRGERGRITTGAARAAARRPRDALLRLRPGDDGRRRAADAAQLGIDRSRDPSRGMVVAER